MSQQYLAEPSRYTVEQFLGQGTAAVVFKGKYNNGKEELPVAIKTINLDFSNQNLEQLQQETKMLATSHHKNICGFYQAMVHQQYLWLVMPSLEISILELMNKVQPSGFEESIIATMMYDILQAIQYLHANNQIHRDIKLSNFLLDKEGTSYLSDFGVASIMRPFSNHIKSTFVGSPLYMAPEVADNKPYNNSCDIWSFGICLYHLATGSLPHENQPGMEALFKVIQQDAPRLPIKKNYSKQFRELVELCLQKNPKERWSAEKLLEHKFWSKRADNSKISGMIAECTIIRSNKQNLYLDKIKHANQILQNKLKQKQQDCWDFEDVDDQNNKTQTQQKEETKQNQQEPQQPQKQVSPQTQKPQTQQNNEEPPFGRDKRRTCSESRVCNQTATVVNNQLQQQPANDSPVVQENNYVNLLSSVQGLLDELHQLRGENQKLKEENARYKERLKMFMNTNTKNE